MVIEYNRRVVEYNRALLSLPYREIIYKRPFSPEKTYFLAADIGGTNSNFGIFEIDNEQLFLTISIHFKSSQITDFPSLILDILAYTHKKHQIAITKCCVAAAGVVSDLHDLVQPTNLSITIDAQKIKQITNLETVVIINDFQAVGYGINEIAPQAIIAINSGKAYAGANKAIIGAGTGLGKGILGFSKSESEYIPIPSEGGHADFAAQNQQEVDFMEYIRKTEKGSCAISWEDVLSGRGIIRLYNFLGTTGSYTPTTYTSEIEKNGHHPDLIFKHQANDQRCNDTYTLFARWYGRCAKNFALDALALGGVYIAGGIAAQNIDLFKLPTFFDEFINCGKQMNLLKNVPLYVIADYNVSLYGAARYLSLPNKKQKK